jgi:hypothetical protein
VIRRPAACNFQIDWTHINKYDNLPAANAATVHVAGTYDRQFGNYAENRATATIGWAMDKFDAQIGARFIDDLVLLLPSGGTLPPEDNPPAADRFVRVPRPVLRVPDQRQHQGVAERNEPVDEQPPMMYQNNVTNANTDVNTYDTLGRGTRSRRRTSSDPDLRLDDLRRAAWRLPRGPSLIRVSPVNFHSFSASVERAGQFLAEGKHAQAEAEARAVLARSPGDLGARVCSTRACCSPSASPKPFRWRSRSSRARRRNLRTG